MESKREKAQNLFRDGYNCSQAVVGAFCEDLGLDFETAIKMSSSFGGGMGRMREVCGAVSGMFMVVGLAMGYSSPTDISAKKEHYALIQDLAAKFKCKNGSIICRELLNLRTKDCSPNPTPRNEEFYKKRSCIDFVGDAAELTEGLLKKCN